MTQRQAKKIWQQWRDSGLMEDVEIHFVQSAQKGIMLAEAIHPAFPCPIGMAYFDDTSNPWIDLNYINVVEQLRKLGCGHAIVYAIRKRYPDRQVRTGFATKLALPFLFKTGWESANAGNGGGWILESLDEKFHIEASKESDEEHGRVIRNNL